MSVIIGELAGIVLALALLGYVILPLANLRTLRKSYPDTATTYRDLALWPLGR